MKEGLQAMPYQEPLWSRRYPKLVNIWEDELAAPKGNLIARNICHGGEWDEIEEKARPFVTFENNLTDARLRFAEPEKGNFHILDDQFMEKIDFKRIPIEKIGLYRDDYRFSVPVRSSDLDFNVGSMASK